MLILILSLTPPTTFYFGVQWLDGSHCVDEEEGVEDAGSHGNLSPPPSEVVTNGNPLQSLSALVTGSLNSNTQLLLQHLPGEESWLRIYKIVHVLVVYCINGLTHWPLGNLNEILGT